MRQVVALGRQWAGLDGFFLSCAAVSRKGSREGSFNEEAIDNRREVRR
jgi:hypothetical protein